MHYHVLGVGGAGMSAIAHLLLDQGHTVSGCDQQRNALTAELAARGAQIALGHDAAHIAGVDVAVMSSAVKPAHPELQAALAAGIPVQKRADLWHAWSAAKPTLAISGTHGKTTTTAIAALILDALGADPAFIVPAGGPVPGLPRFARWGSGPFVIEADEYDRVFLGLVPQVAVITSVDWDHVDIYPTRAAVEAAFAQFAAQSAQVVACSDDAGAQRLAATHAVTEYGLAPNRGWWAGDIQIVDGVTHFVVHGPADVGSPSYPATLLVPGEHNVQNALGAAVGVFLLRAQQTPMPEILAALPRFVGAARRFELKGEAGGVIVVDDYAHNPPKVRAALAAARARYPARRLVVYLQPHTFSRTAALVDEFADAFAAADVVLIGDIYRSREQQADFPAITAAWLVARIQHPNVVAVGDVGAAAIKAQAVLQPGDVLLTLGAGDGNAVGDAVLAARQAEERRG